jgi:flagellin-like hook-associated protein FlgL
MKKVILSIGTFLFLFNAIAQAPDETLDDALQNVNQSTVTSGIIYERVITAANLYNFNKVTTFNQANFGYFKQALSEMRNASNNTRFVNLKKFKLLLETRNKEYGAV